MRNRKPSNFKTTVQVKFSFIFSALSNFLENLISDDHQRRDQQQADGDPTSEISLGVR
jgi:hypothetical protein